MNETSKSAGKGPANPKNPKDTLSFISHSVGQTQRIAARLAEHLEVGDVLLLSGEFGAGKTTFTQGLAAALGVDDYVNSPTFTLVNEYKGFLPIYHIDLYRLDSLEEAIGIGLEDYLDGSGLCVIEWPEKAGELMPYDHLLLRLSYVNETKRTIDLIPHGTRYKGIVETLKKNAFGAS